MIELKENNFLLNEEVNNCLNKIIQNKSFANDLFLIMFLRKVLTSSFKKKLFFLTSIICY